MSARARHTDACTARQVAQWRRDTARLVVLLHAEPPPPALTAEAFALQRQCERLAADFRHLGARARTGCGASIEGSEPASPAASGYLVRKGVQAHGVRVLPGGVLLVPMRDAAGELLQHVARHAMRVRLVAQGAEASIDARPGCEIDRAGPSEIGGTVNAPSTGKSECPSGPARGCRVKARHTAETHADAARRQLMTAHALLACWLHSLPAEATIEAEHAHSWQAAMRAVCALMSEAARTYSEARGIAEGAEFLALYAHGLAECIEGALWMLASGDLPEPLSVPELATTVRHVRHLVQQAIHALPEAAVQDTSLIGR